MPWHALELLPDAATRAWAEGDWAALQSAGLPSQADHGGATNQPHVTLYSGPQVSEQVEQVAARVFGPLLPARVRVGGVLLLGQERVVLARHVQVDEALLGAYLRVTAAAGQGAPRRHLGWTPHLTLARRMPADQVSRALEVLQPAGERDVVLEVLRRWDPDAGHAHQLVPMQGAWR